MQEVTQSSSVKTAPYDHFGCRVAAPDTAHIEPTLWRAQDIGHVMWRYRFRFPFVRRLRAALAGARRRAIFSTSSIAA